MSDTLDNEVLDFILKETGDGSYYKTERISRKIMIELLKAGRAEFLLLRDDEVASWWNKIYSGVHEKFAKHQEKIRVYNVKLEAYNKLSADERKVLGIRKPAKPKGL